jgi:hypothetical protein
LIDLVKKRLAARRVRAGLIEEVEYAGVGVLSWKGSDERERREEELSQHERFLCWLVADRLQAISRRPPIIISFCGHVCHDVYLPT